MKTTGGGEGQFRVKKTPLRDEDIQIVREAAFVSQIGEVQARPESLDLPFLGGRLLTGRADPHERVFNFPERDENCLFVLGYSLLGLGLGRFLLETQNLRIEQRSGQAGTGHTKIGLVDHESGELWTG